MADEKPKVRTLIELPFEGDAAPGQLSVAIVSLVELCQIAMPNADLIRQNILGANFVTAPEARANEAGRMLALDTQVVAMPVRNLRHELFGRERHEELVTLLLSTGDTDQGRIVFLSAIFRGAMEADAVKAAAHVTKAQPATGATARNHDGHTLRRVFWNTEGAGNIGALMVSGPKDVESLELARAFTAFNMAAAAR